MAPAAAEYRISRRYRQNTLILETRFETSEGVVTLLDFMPPRDELPNLVRLVVGDRGRVSMRTEIIFRFDYGSAVPWVSRMDDNRLSAIAGPNRLILQTPVTLRGVDRTTVGEWAVAAGEVTPFVLSHAASHLPPPAPIDAVRSLAETEDYWREWCSSTRSARGAPDEVMRSLITLKALTFRPTGGIVAAPTTSLPERVGGARNWDYRYCWLRDATFTLVALMDSGYFDEARAWREWLLRAVAGEPSQVQIMYGLAGERRLDEWEVPWLAGYQDSRPVRIGNAAAGQLQLDIYGEVVDALYQGRLGQLSHSAVGWDLQRALVKHLESIWHLPDEGIWEPRAGRRQFTHSKVMAWLAFDRAIKTIERFRVDGPLQRWRALRAQIHDEVCRKGFNSEIGAFVQEFGSSELDASALMIALVGFLPPEDPRIRGTVEAIERRLTVDGLVMRYDTRTGLDGLPPGEGAFIACSFWLADNLVLLGRHADARRLYDRLLALRNDLGLLSEQYDPSSRRLVGNFPQAFSHIALINTAYNLMHAKKPAEQRSERAA
jgi:GH15 family glucan-1,4-alpha-glucosidase